MIDEEVLSEIGNPAVVGALSGLMSRGAYVLLISNSSSVIREVGGLLDPPLRCPASRSVTVTKQYRDGRAETEVHEYQLIITGRTFKNLGGRLVPVNVLITVHGFGDSDAAMRRALHELLLTIADLEERFSSGAEHSSIG